MSRPNAILPVGIVAGVAAAIAAALVVDPAVARRRLARVRDKMTMVRTRGPRRMRHAQRAVSSEIYGLRQRMLHLRRETGSDAEPDVAADIESAPFRGTDVGPNA